MASAAAQALAECEKQRGELNRQLAAKEDEFKAMVRRHEQEMQKLRGEVAALNAQLAETEGREVTLREQAAAEEEKQKAVQAERDAAAKREQEEREEQEKARLAARRASVEEAPLVLGEDYEKACLDEGYGFGLPSMPEGNESQQQELQKAPDAAAVRVQAKAEDQQQRQRQQQQQNNNQREQQQQELEKQQQRLQQQQQQQEQEREREQEPEQQRRSLQQQQHQQQQQQPQPQPQSPSPQPSLASPPAQQMPQPATPQSVSKASSSNTTTPETGSLAVKRGSVQLVSPEQQDEPQETETDDATAYLRTRTNSVRGKRGTVEKLLKRLSSPPKDASSSSPAGEAGPSTPRNRWSTPIAKVMGRTSPLDEDGTFRGRNGSVLTLKGSVGKAKEAFLTKAARAVQGLTIAEKRMFEEQDVAEKLGGKIVLYTTSLLTVPETAFRCSAVRKILQRQRVAFEERDIVLSSSLAEEFRERMPLDPTVPQVFFNGKHLGNHDTILEMNETGKLRELFSSMKKLANGVTGECEQCGGRRFIPCTWCGGDRKSMMSKFGTELIKLRCTACNEVGLMKCQACDDKVSTDC